MELIIFLLIGAIAGFTAGLFGVGGGLIIVPILYVVFTQLHYDPAVIMHIAVGTSLATIIVTSFSSVSAHHKKGAVLWPVFRNLAPGLVIGSFLGAGIADLMSGQHLQLLIGIFAVVMAYRMFKGAHVVVDPNRQLPSTPMQFMAGGGIGIACCNFWNWGRKFNRSIFKPSWRDHAKSSRDFCRLRFTNCSCWSDWLYVVWCKRTNLST